MDLQAARRVGGFDHLIDVGGAEVLAGVAELLHATLIADVGVVNDQMRRLVFLVLRARVIDVGELVEGQLAVAFGRADDVRFRAAIRRQAGSAAACDDVRLRCCSGPAQPRPPVNC